MGKSWIQPHWFIFIFFFSMEIWNGSPLVQLQLIIQFFWPCRSQLPGLTLYNKTIKTIFSYSCAPIIRGKGKRHYCLWGEPYSNFHHKIKKKTNNNKKIRKIFMPTSFNLSKSNNSFAYFEHSFVEHLYMGMFHLKPEISFFNFGIPISLIFSWNLPIERLKRVNRLILIFKFFFYVILWLFCYE
jgi:hypothetical protein